MKRIIVLLLMIGVTSVAWAERCAATTRKGAQCKREAQAGSVYCWQHHRMYIGPTSQSK